MKGSDDNPTGVGHVRVKVFDEASGLPLENAHVGVFLVQTPDSQGDARSPDATLLEGRTDADGACVLSAQLHEPVEIKAVARATGHAEWRSAELRPSPASGEPAQQLVLNPGGEEEIRADLEAGITIEGRVTDRRGGPVPDAHVGLVLSMPWGCSWPHAFGVAQNAQWPPPCRTDEDGRFEWLSFPAQHATVHEDSQFVLLIEDERLAPAMVPSVETLTPNEAGVILVTAELQDGASLEGVVLGPSGEPARGATVEASAAPVAGQPVCVRFEKSAQTDDTGRFKLEGLRPTVHQISVEMDRCAPAVREVDLRANPEQALEVRLKPGTDLDGKIVERNGEGLANAVVYAMSSDGSVRRSAVTNDAGEFRITGLPEEGRIELSCNPGIAESIDLPSGPITLSVPPLATLSAVLVSDEDGARLSGGSVTVLGPGFSTLLEGSPDLVFSRDHMPAGHYHLEADVEGFAPTAAEIDLPPTGLEEPVVIRVSRGFQAAGTVTDSSGRGLPGVRVSAIGRSVLRQRRTETKRDGSWALQGLESDIAIVLQADGFATRWQRVRFTHDGPTEVLDLAMREGATIRGRVLSADETPVERTQVTVSAGGPIPFSLPSALTDADGRFTLSHVPAAEWRVLAGTAHKVVKAEHGGTYEVELRLA